MKKVCIFCLVLLTKNFPALSQTVFQRSFGGSHEDYGFAIVKTIDGGFAMAGHSNSFSAGGDFDVLLIKLDGNSNFQWARTYGGSGNDQSLQLVQTSDSGFAIAGKTTSYGSGDFDALLVKADKNGNLQWLKTYGGPQEERLLNIRETSDHGFILSGSTLSLGQGNWDMLFIRTNSLGDTLWTKIIGGADADQGTDADQTTDGDFVFIGRARSWGQPGGEIVTMKVSSNGDTIWSRVFGSPGYDEGMKVKQTSDGNYIVTGASAGFTNTSYDVYLNKIDSLGNLLWSKLYAGNYNDATYDVLQLSDGGYIITGETESFGNNHLRPHSLKSSYDLQSIIHPVNSVLGTDHSNVLAIRADANGDTVWCRTYGANKMDEAYSIVQTLDSGFMFAAFTTDFSNDTTDFYLVKVDKSGYSSCNESPAPLDVINPATVITSISPQIISGVTVNTVSSTSAVQPISQHNICFESTGIIEEDFENQFSLYPNPVRDRLFLNCNLTGDSVTIEIYSMLGEKISGCSWNQTKNMLEMDVSKLAQGVYTLRYSSDKIRVKRFIKE
jgi:hypothetical protein